MKPTSMCKILNTKNEKVVDKKGWWLQLAFKRIDGCCKILIVISCGSESTLWVEFKPTWVPRRVETWIIRSWCWRVVVIHPCVTRRRCDQSHPIWKIKCRRYFFLCENIYKIFTKPYFPGLGATFSFFYWLMNFMLQ